MFDSSLVDDLVRKGWIWQGQTNAIDARQQTFTSTGDATLNDVLGGGWPEGAVVEVQLEQPFQGEMGLMLPALQEASVAQVPSLWVNPPATPYPPGWEAHHLNSKYQWIVRTDTQADAYWVLQNALQAGCCRYVLYWGQLSAAAVRQLQSLAQQQRVLLVVFCPSMVEPEARAYHTRLHLTRSSTQELQIAVKKRRFGWPLPPFSIATDSQFPARRRRKVASANVVQGPWTKR